MSPLLWILAGQGILPSLIGRSLLGGAFVTGLVALAIISARPGRSYLFILLGVLSLYRGYSQLLFPINLARQSASDARSSTDGNTCQPIELKGLVVGEPVRFRPGEVRFDFLPEDFHLVTSLTGRMQLLTADLPWNSSIEFRDGAYLRVVACLRDTMRATTKEPLSSAARQFWRGVYWRGYAQETHLIVPASAEIKEKLFHRLVDHFGTGDDVAVLLSATLGIEDFLGERIRDIFRQSGTTHLLVVSGFQLGMIYLIVSWICSRVLVAVERATISSRGRELFAATSFDTRQWACICGALVAIGYGWFVGLTPPVFRAAIFVSCHVLSALSGRELSGTRVLIFSLCIICLAEPGALLAPSLQLTAAAVIGLMVSRRLMAKANFDLSVNTFGTRCHRAVMQLTCDCFAVFLITAPVVLGWFGTIYWASPLINIIAVPIFSMVGTAGGALGLLAFLFNLPGGSQVIEVVLIVNRLVIDGLSFVT